MASAMEMINRYKAQSISVNDEELQAIKQLAARLRMKPAAMARAFFYRALAKFLEDGLIHAEETEDVVFRRLQQFLDKERPTTPVYQASNSVHEAPGLHYERKVPHLTQPTEEKDKSESSDE